MIQNYRDLSVWQKSMDLTEKVYAAASVFPKEEVYALSAQARRAAMSIPLNIAEGHTRESTKEYLQHLSIAQGSLAELETCLILAGRLHWLSDEAAKDLLERCFELGRMLYGLRNSLRAALARRPASARKRPPPPAP